MSEQKSNSYPWVVFSLNRAFFGITAENVQAMVNTPKVYGMPLVPGYVRGVINLRNRVIPLVDLRVKLGMPSFLQEVEDFCSMMAQREKDHKNWLVELETSVREKREFKLATDPHKCAFGKWYDDYKPKSHSLAVLLRKFDVPHRKIHSIAVQVKDLEEKGETDRAHQIIESCRDRELAQMISLFSQLREGYKELQHETAIVIKSNETLFAVAVDSVESIEHFVEDSLSEINEEHMQISEQGLLLGTGKRKKSNELVMLLDDSKIAAELKRKSN